MKEINIHTHILKIVVFFFSLAVFSFPLVLSAQDNREELSQELSQEIRSLRFKILIQEKRIDRMEKAEDIRRADRINYCNELCELHEEMSRVEMPTIYPMTPLYPRPRGWME